MCLQLIMVIVIEAVDGLVLDWSVHPLDLFICPKMVWLGQAVLDVIRLADHVKAHLPLIALTPTREAVHYIWDQNNPKEAQFILHMLQN